MQFVCITERWDRHAIESSPQSIEDGKKYTVKGKLTGQNKMWQYVITTSKVKIKKNQQFRRKNTLTLYEYELLMTQHKKNRHSDLGQHQQLMNQYK